ncbi:hypothetical protein KIN20_012492 [Parelaphostrongylus tenuis]|uniref:Uncharacterized protein n=1 Tax=Parelaphostrongylus tenuis TaxID=148309 RepID=A0AAD5QLU4_PARTN|nr:hypothetical protein KIN20_012492 [Parelaphostrongylus tenuis]
MRELVSEGRALGRTNAYAYITGHLLPLRSKAENFYAAKKALKQSCISAGTRRPLELQTNQRRSEGGEARRTGHLKALDCCRRRPIACVPPLRISPPVAQPLSLEVKFGHSVEVP